MNRADHNLIIQQLEATCGCTNAARTAAIAMRQLMEEHADMVRALHEIADIGYEGAPDIAMRRIAREALTTVGAA